MNKKDKKIKIAKLIFYIYIIILFFIVAVKFTGNNLDVILQRCDIISSAKEAGTRNLNLTPFTTIKLYLRHIEKPYAYTNIVANLLFFVPVGFLIPIAFPKHKKFLKTMIICLIIVASIEIFQYITCLGFCDIDDVILNMVGSMTGFIVYKCTRKT